MYNNITALFNKNVFFVIFGKMKIQKATSNVGAFLTKTQNTILSAAFILGVSSGINSILGFVKTRILATYFGVSNDLAIFYTADKIPNLLYTVLIVGAISTIFIPIFTESLKKDKLEASKVGSSIITATLILFSSITIVTFILSERIMRLLAVGTFTDEEIILGSNLMRIMMGAQIFLISGSLTTSVLQSFKYFLIPSLAPIAYNSGVILGTILFSKRYGIYGPAIGVVIGALLNFLVQVPLLRKTDFKFHPELDLKNKSFRKMLSLIPPKLLGSLTWNLTDTVQNSVALLISASSAVYLKFSNQLQSFPVSLIGLSIAAAMFPTLSLQEKKENMENFKNTLITSLHQTLYLVMPISAILLILRVPIVRLVYGVSSFPWQATLMTSYTLAFFSISIFSQSISYLFSRAFYALKDTVTPLIISLLSAVINIVLSVFFIKQLNLEVWSIAFAYSITSILSTAMQFFFLNKKVGGFNLGKVVTPFIKISVSTLFMSGALWVPLRLLDQFVFDTTRTIYLLALTLITSIIGISTYFIITKSLKVEEVELFYKLIRKIKPKTQSLEPKILEYNKNGSSSL